MKASKTIERVIQRYGKNGGGTKSSARVVSRWYVCALEVAAFAYIATALLFSAWAYFEFKGTEQYREEISALQGRIEAQRRQNLAALDEAAEITDSIIAANDKIIKKYDAVVIAQRNKILHLLYQLEFEKEKSAHYKRGKAENEKTAAAYLQALRGSRDKSERLILDNTQLRIRLANRNVSKSEARQQAESFVRWSKHYRYPLQSALRVGWVESRFKADAVSEAGAQGVMQVLPFWADEFDYITRAELRTDTDKNIRAGINVLARYFNVTGSAPATLVAYNQGITRLRTGDIIESAATDYLASYNEAGITLGE